MEPFSRSELIAAGGIEPAPLETLPADDGTPLAYRRYLPQGPVAVLVFNHGGGAHSGAGYAHVATGLRDAFRIAVYTPDLRGHGASGGARGDAPSAEQMWRDVESFARLARREHPGLPLFVGGHSSGAGLTLNYASFDGRSEVDGWVLVSPQLGYKSDTARAPEASSGRTAFVEASVAPFVINALSGGRLMGHNRAVVFNYPPQVLEADPGMVGWNTVNLANGITPQAPGEQFAALDRPFGLWIGGEDEIFVPRKVVAFGARAEGVRESSASEVVPDQTHLGILVHAAEFVGPWIVATAARPGG
jgi:acylglycerol lipase